MSKMINIWSWDDPNGRWLAVGGKSSQQAADEDVARRIDIAARHGIPRTTFYASTSAPAMGPRQMGLELTPDAPEGASAPSRPARKLGHNAPGARKVRITVDGYVDDADQVWFGAMSWPRDVFELGGGVITEVTP